MALSDTQSKTTKKRGFSLIWDRLTAPSASIEEVGAQRQARLLASLTLSISLIVAIAVFVALNEALLSVAIALAATAAFMLVAYLISRSRYYQVGAFLVVGSLSLIAFLRIVFGETNVALNLFAFLPFAFLFSTIFLSRKISAAIVALNLLGILSIPLWASFFTFLDIVIGLGPLFTLGLLSLIAQYYRDNVEKDRLAALTETNVALERLRYELDVRVKSRTQALYETTTALDVSEQRYALAVAGSNDGIWDWNIEADEIYFSPRWKEMIGFADHEIKDDFAEYERRLHPDERDEVMATVSDYLDGKIPALELELRLQHKDGSYRWFLVRGAAQRDEHGNPLRLAGSHTDITDRVQAEQNVKEEQARTRQILEAITVPLLVSRIKDNRVVYANKPLAELLEIPRDALLGQLTPDFYQNPADRAAYVENLQSKGKVINLDLNLKRGNGQPFWGLLSGRVIQFQGAPAIITSVVDITERREAQVTLTQRATELETVAAVSTVAATILDPTELLQQVVDLTKNRFELYHAHIYLLDEPRSDLVLTIGAGDIGRRMVTEGRRIPLNQEQSLVARAARTQKGVVINDVQTDPGFLPHPLLPETRAEMAVPLIAGNEVQGVLDVQADSINVFTAEKINIFTTFASQIAVALQNARRYEESQRALDELTRLQRIMAREGWEDYLKAQERPFLGYAINYSGAQPIADQNQIESVTGHSGGRTNGSAVKKPSPPPDSAVSIPIAVRGETIGQLGLRNPDGGAIPARKQALLKNIAQQVSEALERARLSEQTQQALAETNEQARRLTVLNDLSELISRMETLEDTASVIIKKVPDILDATRLSLHLLDEEDPSMLRVAGVSGQIADMGMGFMVPLEGSPMAEALEKRQLVTGYFDTGQEELPAYFVPLYAAGRPLGTLNIALPVGSELSEGERQILLQIASMVGTTLDNRRLFDQTRARADRERLLNNIATQISASLDLQHSLQIVVDELVTAVNVDQVRIALLQPDGNNLQIVAEHHDQTRSPSALGETIPVVGNALTQEVIDTRKIIVVEDAQANPRTEPVHDLFRTQGIETFILMPLVVADEVIGTVGLDILEKRPVNRDSLQLVETIVYQAAAAVQNARLFEQTQAALAETEMLYAYSSQLNAATSLDAVLEAAAAPGFQVGATDARLLVYDQETDGRPRYGQIVAAVPKVDHLVGTLLTLVEQPFSNLWPASGKNIVFVGDIDQDERLLDKERAVFRENNVQAVALMFMTVGNLQLGQIMIHWDKPQTFTSADERLFGAIAQQASSVVYNRLLFNQTEEALSETAALYQASTDLNSAQSFEQVLTALQQHTILGQGSSQVALHYFTEISTENKVPDEAIILASWSTAPNSQITRYKVEDIPEATTILMPDESFVCEDLEQDSRLSSAARKNLRHYFQAESLLFVPLVVAGQWVGFINGVFDQPMHFSDAQIRRLDVLVRQASVSIQSIRLYEQTNEVLAETEALYVGSENIVLSSSEDDILQALIRSTMLQSMDRANLFLFDEPVEDSQAQDVTAVAVWENEGIPRLVEVGTRFGVDQLPFLAQVKPDISLFIQDAGTDDRVDEQTLAVLDSFGMRSFVLYPVVAGNQWLGIVSGQSARPVDVDEAQVRRAVSLVSQAAVVIQTTLLFRQEQARAQREQLLREISAKLRSSTDIDTIMRTAVSEIGRTLGRRSFIKLKNGMDDRESNDEHG